MKETPVTPLKWEGEKLILIDQRKLPLVEEYVTVTTLEEAYEAIKVMVVRGAPLIGFSALYGMCLWVKNHPQFTIEELEKAGAYLNEARPTAVNLGYEIQRVAQLAKDFQSKNGSFDGFYQTLQDFSKKQIDDIYEHNLEMAKLAEKELEERVGPGPYRLITLCNTGFLACGPLGTALGVITYLHSKGKIEHVYASETRPYLQGGRLTAYELMKSNIPHSIIVEGAHSYLLRSGLAQAAFIGADRIVKNGDTANKIGSSTLAIVCKHYNIPFYVVAPTSSFDLNAQRGDDIHIELRPEEEILFCGEKRIAPKESSAWNPSFDVTEAPIIEAIFCEKGKIKPVNQSKLTEVLGVK